MNKSFTIIVAVIFLVAAFMLGSNIDKESAVSSPEPTATPVVKELPEIDYTSGDDDYFREGYMEGCVGSDHDMEDYCVCTYDELVQRYGKSGIWDLAEEYETNPDSELVQEMFDYALEQCISEL